MKSTFEQNVYQNISRLLRQKAQVLIAIDGRASAGKTTLAGKLKENLDCNVIHMDDFFLRPEQRTPERYQEPGGNVDYERVLEEVILPIQKGKGFSYRPFSCKTMDLKDPVSVVPKALTILEGSYSCHPKLWDAADLHIFLTVSKEEQRRRIQLRNGDEALPMFLNKWIPLEEAYFKAYQIEEHCELKNRTE